MKRISTKARQQHWKWEQKKIAELRAGQPFPCDCPFAQHSTKCQIIQWDARWKLAYRAMSYLVKQQDKREEMRGAKDSYADWQIAGEQAIAILAEVVTECRAELAILTVEVIHG